MKVTVKITQSFKIALKPLLKKFPSLSQDLLQLEKELLIEPQLGTPLGKDLYKIRMKISSKGKGKSGGARVITLLETNVIGLKEYSSDKEMTVNLLTIYNKGDVSSISDSELKELAKKI